MAATLAKLTRPAANGALIRKRLFTLLDNACNSPIVWVSAPAGAGKTTLISSYIENNDIPCLWYKVDNGDTDAASFFYYLGLAVKKLGWRKALPLLTPEYQQGLPVFSRNYFRELYSRLKPPFSIVLDNYQDVATDAIIHQLLREGFQEIPQGINLIIISRNTPHPCLTRFFANEQPNEITWADLQLTFKETESFNKRLDARRKLNKAQLTQLHNKVHGWFTGLVLLLKQNNVIDSVNSDMLPNNEDVTELENQEYLFDYFAGEIFQRANSDLQDLLLKTAWLPKFSVAAAKQISGLSQSKHLLNELFKQQFFIMRHNKLKPVYEYHPLFRHFLQNLSQTTLTKDALHKIKQQTAQILADAGQVEDAIPLFQQVQDWKNSSQQIKKHAERLLKQGRHETVRQWIINLPSSHVENEPWLLFWQGSSWLFFVPAKAKSDFDKAYQLFTKTDDIKGRYLSLVGSMDALFNQMDDFSGAIPLLDELDHLRAQHPRYPGLEIRGRTMVAVIHLGIFAHPSDSRLSEWIKQAQWVFRLIPVAEIRTILGYILSWVYMLHGEHQKIPPVIHPLQHILKSDSIPPIIRAFANHAVLTSKYCTEPNIDFSAQLDQHIKFSTDIGLNIFRVLQSQPGVFNGLLLGDAKLCKRYLEYMGEHCREASRQDAVFYHFLSSLLHSLENATQQALEHAKIAAEMANLLQADFTKMACGATLAQVLAETGSYDESLHEIETVRSLLPKNQYRLWNFHCDCAEAWLALQKGQEALAIPALTKAFRWAKIQHVVASPLWRRDLMQRLCELALAHNIEIDYVKQLIQLHRFTPSAKNLCSEQWPWQIKVYTLGHFSILLNDQPIDTDSRPVDLLKIMLAYGGNDVHEEKIMDALWPEADGDQAQANFKTTLHRLRKTLDNLDALLLKNHRLSLNKQYVWADTWALEHLFTRAENTEPSQTVALATKLTRLYRDHFLASEPASWAIHQREGLRIRFIRNITALAQSFEHENSQAAIQCYQRLLEIDSLIEEAYQGLIRIYRAQGRQAEAKATYQKCVDILASTSGVPPSNKTTALM